MKDLPLKKIFNVHSSSVKPIKRAGLPGPFTAAKNEALSLAFGILHLTGPRAKTESQFQLLGRAAARVRCGLAERWKTVIKKMWGFNINVSKGENGDVGSGTNNWEGTQRGYETRWRRGLEIGELFACWVVQLWVWAECWGLIDWLKIVGLAKCAKIPTHFNHPICYKKKMCLKYECGKFDMKLRPLCKAVKNVFKEFSGFSNWQHLWHNVDSKKIEVNGGTYNGSECRKVKLIILYSTVKTYVLSEL